MGRKVTRIHTFSRNFGDFAFFVSFYRDGNLQGFTPFHLEKNIIVGSLVIKWPYRVINSRELREVQEGTACFCAKTMSFPLLQFSLTFAGLFLFNQGNFPRLNFWSFSVNILTHTYFQHNIFPAHKTFEHNSILKHVVISKTYLYLT